MTAQPTDISIITTYRCPMQCRMCDIWNHPTDKQREITPQELELLPNVRFINITGGEPFIREDLDDIVAVAFRKSPRVVISTSGWFDDRVIALARKFPHIGLRISIEGLSRKNDELRGRPGGFDKGLRTLLTLREMGVKDIGFGITVSGNNSHDMISLYHLSKSLGMEFATAAFHNSFYFHKHDNVIEHRDAVCEDFKTVIRKQLSELHPKSWFRAYFNMGLVNYIRGGARLLPCEAGTTNFFIDPYGEVYPCNGMEERDWKKSMGNIRSVRSFDEIWLSKQAAEVRRCVSTCSKNCWMVGTVAPVMKKNMRTCGTWVFKNKFNLWTGREIEMCEKIGKQREIE